MAIADRGTVVVIVGWILFGISSMIVALRVYVRAIYVKQFVAHDYLVVVSWVFLTLQTTFLTIAWTHGLGQHIETLSATQLEMSLKYMIVFAEPFAVACSMFSRISFCLLLLTVLGWTYPRRRVLLMTVIAVQVVINLIVIIQIVAQCRNRISSLWNPAVARHAHCLNPMVQTVLGFVQGSINSLCDLVLVFMPILILWNLQIAVWQKVRIAAMLTLSIFACAASITKTIMLQDLAKDDITWWISNLNLAVVTENNVVIIAASIATLRRLTRKSEPQTTNTHQYYYDVSIMSKKNKSSDDLSHTCSEGHMLDTARRSNEEVAKPANAHTACAGEILEHDCSASQAVHAHD